MAATTLDHPSGGLREAAASRPRTAFVLSGGASLGALQVGMLGALYEQGIVPDLLVGTSAGALNAAFVASRPQSAETARALGRVWRDLQREDIFPVSISALVGGLRGRRDHLVPGRGLRRLVQRYVEFDELTDAPIPLHVAAFDLAEGRELLLSQGPAVDAVVAAASIPGVFPPVAIGNRRLVDGGVVNNTPISHAAHLGAERIYVLPTEDPAYRPADYAPKTALDAAIYGLRLLVHSRLEADIARYSGQVELIVMPSPNPGQVQPTSFEHAARLMTDARIAGRAVLARRNTGTHLRLAGVTVVYAITPLPGHRQVVDDVVLAYVQWREESAAVWDAYDQWASASAEEKLSADAAYRAALDREEAAAKSYAELIELARDRLDTACDLPPLPRDSD